jgi:hypothetical protein
MGNLSDTNNNLSYHDIEENVEVTIPQLNPFHSKGKPYGKILDFDLNSKYINEWSYFPVYDLRNGKVSNWRFFTRTVDNEFLCKLKCIKKVKD